MPKMIDFSKSLTPEQESDLVTRILLNRKIIFSHGGKNCHCGGLIYPDIGEGERHTCTHGNKQPLTAKEITAYFDRWKNEEI